MLRQRSQEKTFLPSTNKDLSDSPTLTPQHFKILLVVVGIILFYLFFRFLVSSGAGISNFQPQYCYEIMGYTTDTYFIQARCWADQVKEQTKSSNSQAIFSYWAPTSRREFETRLKELKSTWPEMRRHWGSPVVFEGCNTDDMKYLGGYNDFLSSIQQRYKVTSNGECASFI